MAKDRIWKVDPHASYMNRLLPSRQSNDRLSHLVNSELTIMPSATAFRVAIVGGGIGGLCTALSIHHHCGSAVSIDVYEQASQYKEIGAGVGIGVNAAKLLYKIGVGEAVQKIAGLRDGVWISFRKFDDGSDVVTVPEPDAKVKQLPVHRAEFLDLLLETVREKDAAKLHTHKRCRKLTVSILLSAPMHTD